MKDEIKRKGGVAIWGAKDIFSQDLVYYLKKYKNDKYRLMSFRPDKRDRKVAPKGRRKYYSADKEKIVKSVDNWLENHDYILNSERITWQIHSSMV